VAHHTKLATGRRRATWVSGCTPPSRSRGAHDIDDRVAKKVSCAVTNAVPKWT